MQPRRRNALGAACIAGAAVAYSLIPLPIRYAGDGFSVLVLGTLMESACATMLLVALAVTARPALGVGPLQAMRPARLVALPPVAMAGPRPGVLLALLLITAPNVLLYAGTAALLPLVVLSCFSDGLDVVPQSLLIARWSGSSRSISTRSATMMCGLPIAVAAVIWSQTAPGQLEGGSWQDTAVGLVLGVLTTATYAVRPSAGIIYGDRCALARREGRRAASVKEYGVNLWWSTFAASAVSIPIAAAVGLTFAFGGLGATRSAAFGALSGLIMGCRPPAAPGRQHRHRRHARQQPALRVAGAGGHMADDRRRPHLPARSVRRRHGDHLRTQRGHRSRPQRTAISPVAVTPGVSRGRGLRRRGP